MIARSGSRDPFPEQPEPLPLATLSVQLAGLLAGVLRIGESPLEAGHPFQALFFESEVPLERLFCLVMATVERDWRDMSAGSGDVEKVSSAQLWSKWSGGPRG